MGRYNNDCIKVSEIANFEHIDPKEKAEVMCRYLLFNGATMPKVALEVYNDEGLSRKVSQIHRGYNFGGQNPGRYSPTSAFCRKYGEVYQEDIEAFTEKYPKGIRTTDNPGSGIELDEFLKERIAQRQSYDYDYDDEDDDYDEYDEDDSDYEENDFYNNVGYQNSKNNRRKSRNTFSISQYTNRETGNSYNSKSSNNSRNLDDIDFAMVGTIVACGAGLFIVFALLFNWFHWRSKLLVFISEWIQVVWLFGMMIFLLRIVMGKVDFMYGKPFIGKVVSFLIIGVITYLIVSLFGYLCYYFSMK